MSNDTMQIVNHKKYIIPSQLTEICSRWECTGVGRTMVCCLTTVYEYQKSGMSTATADVVK